MYVEMFDRTKKKKNMTFMLTHMHWMCLTRQTLMQCLVGAKVRSFNLAEKCT